MIAELLFTGKYKPRTGRELAAALNCDIRTVNTIIERERKAGKPICANTDSENPGYYLAETKEEAEAYCESLKHRAIAIFSTMHAVEQAGKKLPSRDDPGADDTENSTKAN